MRTAIYEFKPLNCAELAAGDVTFQGIIQAIQEPPAGQSALVSYDWTRWELNGSQVFLLPANIIQRQQDTGRTTKHLDRLALVVHNNHEPARFCLHEELGRYTVDTVAGGDEASRAIMNPEQSALLQELADLGRRQDNIVYLGLGHSTVSQAERLPEAHYRSF